MKKAVIRSGRDEKKKYNDSGSYCCYLSHNWNNKTLSFIHKTSKATTTKNNNMKNG